MRESLNFLADWRGSAIRGYRHQYGLFLALPMIWGCLDAFLFPWFATAGFLAGAWFLEGRSPRRMAWQSLIFAGWMVYLDAAYPPGRPWPSGPAQLAGEVQGQPTQQGDWTLVLDTDAGKFKVIAAASSFPIEAGQSLRVSGRYSPPAPPSNPGQFDYRAQLLSQGIMGVVRADSLVLTGPPGRWARMVGGLRAGLRAAIAGTVPAGPRPLVEAALLGSSQDLSAEVLEDFRASGMLHILAISGQHIGILALILLQIGSLLRLPRKAAFVATAAFLVLYVPVSGGSISVVRSAWMFSCALPAVLWERESLTLNNLGLSAVFCLAAMPYQILSLGFQLSFAATFFLILYSPTLSGILSRCRIRHPVPVYLLSTTALSAVIFLGLFPLLSSSVHQVAPSSILGNLATVGLSSGMLVASCLALLTGPIPGPWGECFGETAGLCAGLLSLSVHALAHWPGSSLSVPSLPIGWSGLLLLLLLVFPCAARRGRGTALLLLGTAVFAGRWAFLQADAAWREPASVAFLDVGQGDAAFCRLTGAAILVDAGPPEAGRNVLLPYLRSQGVNRLDLVLITHAHLDHYGGLAWLVPRIPIGKVLYPGEESESSGWKSLKALLASRGIPLVAVRRGQVLYRHRRDSLEMLAPEGPGQFPGHNDNSLVCLLHLPRSRFLFTGDMENVAQAWLLSRSSRRLEGAVLKVPHHGSDRSNTLPFLATVRPGTAVISAGRKNRFGHPGPATVEALHGLGARVYLTSLHGAVIYTCSRRRETWSGWLHGGRSPSSARSM